MAIRHLYAQAATDPPDHLSSTRPRARFDFALGSPALETFPIKTIREIANRLLDEDGPADFDYYDLAVGRSGAEELTYGPVGLRRELARFHTERDGRPFGADGVVVTCGSAQAIALVASAYLEHGDGVVVEDATFPSAVRYMAATGAAVARAPMDDDNIDVEGVERRFEEMAQQGVRPKLVYVAATFNAPTGTTLPVSRRRRLLDLAEQWDVLVVEDNVYYDLRYEGEDLPTMLSLDEAGRVIQIGSFSKIVMPGLRLGWAAGVAEAIRPLTRSRQDLGVSLWLSRIMETWLREGQYQPHRRSVAPVYRMKRDVAMEAVRAYCAPLVTCRSPSGSFYLWLELSDVVEVDRFWCRVREEGVALRSGEASLGGIHGRRFARLTFANPTAHEARVGIATIGRALTAAVSGSTGDVHAPDCRSE